jgi:hypothetical protein
METFPANSGKTIQVSISGTVSDLCLAPGRNRLKYVLDVQSSPQIKTMLGLRKIAVSMLPCSMTISRFPGRMHNWMTSYGPGVERYTAEAEQYLGFFK